MRPYQFSLYAIIIYIDSERLISIIWQVEMNTSLGVVNVDGD